MLIGERRAIYDDIDLVGLTAQAHGMFELAAEMHQEAARYAKVHADYKRFLYSGQLASLCLQATAQGESAPGRHLRAV